MVEFRGNRDELNLLSLWGKFLEENA